MLYRGVVDFYHAVFFGGFGKVLEICEVIARLLFEDCVELGYGIFEFGER